MRRKVLRRQLGQAAVEFIFALLFVIALASVLYQVLHFELDVFNKMGILRFKSVQRMHYNNQQYDHEFDDDSQTVSFKPLSQLTSYRVIFQTADQNMKYPDKRLSYKRGSKFFFPGGSAAYALLISGTAACIGLADHFEDTAGNCVTPYKVLASAFNAIPNP